MKVLVLFLEKFGSISRATRRHTPEYRNPQLCRCKNVINYKTQLYAIKCSVFVQVCRFFTQFSVYNVYYVTGLCRSEHISQHGDPALGWTGSRFAEGSETFCASPHPDQLQDADRQTTGSGSTSLTSIYIRNSWICTFTVPNFTAQC